MHLIASYLPVTCDKRLAPKGVYAPHLSHYQAAWLIPSGGLVGRWRSCLTGLRGHDPTGMNKMLTGERFALTQAVGAARAKGLNDGHFRTRQARAAGLGMARAAGARRSACGPRHRTSGRPGRGQVGAQGLADPLRYAARRQVRAMRPDPERDRRGPRQCRPDGHRAQDRRPEEPADAGGGAARRAAAVRAWGSRSTMPISAAPASCAACPTAASPRW